MGEIYTSYYNRAKALDPNRWEFVQISNSKPTWWEYATTKLDAVIPPWNIVSDYKAGRITWAKYTDEYNYYLNNEDMEDAIGTIEKLAEAKNVVLLCWEDPTNKCHRHLFADYMNKLGIEVKELVLK